VIATREAWQQAVRRKTYALRDYARAFHAASICRRALARLSLLAKNDSFLARQQIDIVSCCIVVPIRITRPEN
jgi:hypothetical protein